MPLMGERYSWFHHERRTTAVRTQEHVLGCGGEMLMLRPWTLELRLHMRRGSPHGRAIPAQRTPASRLCADPLSADQTGRRRRANGKGEMRRWGMRLHPRRGAAGDAPCIYNKLYSKIALTSTAHLRRSVTRRMYVEL